jgi:pyruvate dehydrogenase E2 component (dihydrolipoamide acetyltransferase)/2-oxoisovalerate dehydrogenase E2 component (dihydrolipoyl transacylase)
MKKIHTVNLPDIGEGVVEGEVIEWLKQVGEPVAQDEPVVIVMTDKATVELPAPCPGILSKQYFKVAEIAIKDKPLYDIETSEESEEKVVVKEITPIQIADTFVKESIKEEKPNTDSVLAIPLVRKMAKEMGIELKDLQGTGKNGRITVEDLKNYKQQPSFSFPEHPLHLPGDEEIPVVGVKSLMAKKMMESKTHIPQFSFFEQLDATRLVKLKEKFKEEASKVSVKVTYMPFILRALSLTLTAYPEVNSSFDMGKNQLIIHKPHHIGIAITSAHGLIVPVLKNVQNMGINEIIRAYEDLKSRAEANKLLPSEMKESTITVTNFGVFGGGVEFATPIINYPEVAILGVARIQKEPAVKNDTLIIRDTLHLSWSFDHRVIDGDMAARFSHHLASLLQNPASLL